MIDLLPLRSWTLSVWFLTGLCVVVAHATLYAGYLHWQHSVLPIDLSALHLSGPQTLIRWTSSCMLLLSALFAFQILHLRRHRIDDYRARYRVWYYVIAALLLGSMDLVAGLHRMVDGGAQMLVARSTLPLPAASLTWLLVSLAVALALSVVLEVRGSRGATVCVVAAGLAYVAFGVIRQTGIPRLPARLETMTEGLMLLLGHYLLLMSFVVYGRHVYLDAQGRLTPLASRQRAPRLRLWNALSLGIRKREASTETVEGSRSEEPAAGEARKSAVAKPRLSTQAADGDKPRGSNSRSSQAAPSQKQEEQENDSPATLPLSRSERKRMKKQQRRDRRAA